MACGVTSPIGGDCIDEHEHNGRPLYHYHYTASGKLYLWPTDPRASKTSTALIPSMTKMCLQEQHMECDGNLSVRFQGAVSWLPVGPCACVCHTVVEKTVGL